MNLNPFSDEFRNVFATLREEVQMLRKNIEIATAQIVRLDDKFGSTIVSQGSSITIPVAVTGGSGGIIQCSFEGAFDLKQYRPRSMGDDPEIGSPGYQALPDWLQDAPENFSVPNVLNSQIDPGPEKFHHGTSYQQDCGIATPAPVAPSGALVTLYRNGIIPGAAGPAWELDELKYGINQYVYGIGYLKPDVSVACDPECGKDP